MNDTKLDFPGASLITINVKELCRTISVALVWANVVTNKDLYSQSDGFRNIFILVVRVCGNLVLVS